LVYGSSAKIHRFVIKHGKLNYTNNEIAFLACLHNNFHARMAYIDEFESVV